MSYYVRFKATDDELRQLTANVMKAANIEPPARLQDLYIWGEDYEYAVHLLQWKGRDFIFNVWRQEGGEYYYLIQSAFETKPWFGKFGSLYNMIHSVPSIEIIESLEKGVWMNRLRERGLIR